MIKNQIKAIAFDIGGILTKTDFKKFYVKLKKLSKDYQIDSNKFHSLRVKYSKDSVVG